MLMYIDIDFSARHSLMRVTMGMVIACAGYVVEDGFSFYRLLPRTRRQSPSCQRSRHFSRQPRQPVSCWWRHAASKAVIKIANEVVVVDGRTRSR